jgi:F-type H+-transporting ATPase subunit delta
MDPLTVDITYATALYEAAVDTDSVREVGEELKALQEIFEEHPSLKQLFVVPTVPATGKKKTAGEIFDGKLSTIMMNFLYILIDKRRIASWDGIERMYFKIMDDRDGLTKGIVYSAVPLSDDKVKAFEKGASGVFSKQVKLENRVDETLIGGVRIYVEGNLIDISIRHRLEQMKQAMLGKR